VDDDESGSGASAGGNVFVDMLLIMSSMLVTGSMLILVLVLALVMMLVVIALTGERGPMRYGPVSPERS
jgi:uncharacterized membrane protein YhaH (DUF805 family)